MAVLAASTAAAGAAGHLALPEVRARCEEAEALFKAGRDAGAALAALKAALDTAVASIGRYTAVE